MERIIASLLPIVLLVATGAALLRAGFFTNGFRRGLDQLVYFVALPSLIVAKLSQAGAIGPDAGWLVLVLVGATTVALVAAYLTGWAMRMPGPATATLVQAGFRGNLAFVGLPVIDLATRGDHAAVGLAALVLGPMVGVYNLAAVIVLLLGQHQVAWSAIPRVLKSLLTNPLLIACALGVLLSLTGVSLPGPIESTLALLGQTAAPLALLSLGGTLIIYPVKSQLGRATAGALIKTAITPFAAWGLGTLVGLDAQQVLILMIFAAAPTAVASYVLTTKLGGDEALAASTIVLSTLLSAGSLGVALALAGG